MFAQRTRLTDPRVGIFIGLTFYVGSAFAAGKSAGRLANLATPEKTIRGFVAALNKADLKGASACVIGSKPRTPGLEELWRIQRKELGGLYSLEHATFAVQRNTAIAQLQVKIGAQTEFYKRAERMRLARQGRVWRIVPSGKSSAFQANAGLLQSQADLLAHPEEMLKIFNRAKATAQKMMRQKKAGQQPRH